MKAGFTLGFNKVAVDMGKALNTAGRFLRRPEVIRNAAIGAGTGAAAGAVNSNGDRTGGAIKGALVGGLTGGLGTAAVRGTKVMKRLKGPLGSTVETARKASAANMGIPTV